MSTQLLAKVRRALDYLEHPSMLVARQSGVHVGFVEELLELRAKFGIRPRTFVDVGANVGDFSAAARWLYPDAQIHAFEPNPELLGQLSERLAGDARAQVHAVALADRAGRSEFHLTATHTLASLLAPSPGLGAQFGEREAATRVLQVETARLDEVLSAVAIEAPGLLKIDVQGAEVGVLQGSSAILDRFSVVKLEVSFASFYQGQSAFGQIVELMTGQGFHAFYQQGLSIAGGRPCWCDIVFVR